MNGKQVSLSADTLDLLKEKILKSAIKGKLVPQLDKEPEMEQIGDAPEEAPFEIPPKWKWVKLSVIASSNIGLTYKPTDLIDDLGGTPVLRANNIQNGKLNLEGLKRVKGANQLPKNFVHPGDLLMCARNGSKRLVGKCCLIPELKERMMFGAFMAVIRSDFSSYLHIFFSSDAFKAYLGSVNTTTINQITQKNLLNTWVPLPPLEEQKRIVEKVKCLFSKIDVIQKSKDEVSRLSKSLKKQLLQSSISGKLVPQLDEELEVEQIGDAPEEVPFEIPEKWKWVRLESLGTLFSGKTPKADELTSSGNIPYFKISDMNSSENQKYMRHTEHYLKTTPKKIFKAGSIIFPKNGGAVFTNKRRFLVRDSIVDLNTGGFYPNKNYLDESYAFLLLSSIDFREISKGTALPTIDSSKLKSYLVPLPPLGEQRRIVEKFEKLMLEIQKLK